MAVVPRQQIIVDILFPMDTVPTEGLTVKHIHTGREGDDGGSTSIQVGKGRRVGGGTMVVGGPSSASHTGDGRQDEDQGEGVALRLDQ